MKKIINKKYGNSRAITLIALIITIIVMLILVAVSLTIAMQTGIFDTAGKATQDWKVEQEHEQQIAGGQVTVNNKVYNSIDDYVKETQNTITFYVVRMDFENGGVEETLCFKVEKGTTWEDFLSENQIYEGYDNNGYYWLYDGSYDETASNNYPLGCICLTGSGAIYELPGSYDDGPWIFPEDPIKNGVTYNWYFY